LGLNFLELIKNENDTKMIILSWIRIFKYPNPGLKTPILEKSLLVIPDHLKVVIFKLHSQKICAF
jgi:hypothetical protein